MKFFIENKDMQPNLNRLRRIKEDKIIDLIVFMMIVIIFMIQMSIFVPIHTALKICRLIDKNNRDFVEEIFAAEYE